MEGLNFLIPYDLEAITEVGTFKVFRLLREVSAKYEKREEVCARIVNHINDKSSIFPGAVACGYINSVPSLHAMEPSFYNIGNVGETKEISLGHDGDSGPETGIGARCEIDAKVELGQNYGSLELQRMDWAGLGFNLSLHKAPIVLDDIKSLSHVHNSRRNKTRNLVSSVKTRGSDKSRKPLEKKKSLQPKGSIRAHQYSEVQLGLLQNQETEML
ncbi:hypothetical protein Ancab_011877 [Ancistrocladus abbreviatus]